MLAFFQHVSLFVFYLPITGISSYLCKLGRETYCYNQLQIIHYNWCTKVNGQHLASSNLLSTKCYTIRFSFTQWSCNGICNNLWFSVFFSMILQDVKRLGIIPQALQLVDSLVSHHQTNTSIKGNTNTKKQYLHPDFMRNSKPVI